MVFKFYSTWKDFSLASATMQVTNFTSGKVPKLKRLLCERCSYVPCPSNVLCNFPSSKLFSALDEVSGNASLFLTYNIIHCTLQHTAISYMILLCINMRSLMCLKNGLRKNAEVYCQLSQKDKQLVQLQNNVQIINITHSNHCTGGCRKNSET